MKDFRNKIFGLIDTGSSRAKTLIDNFNDVVGSIDMSAHLDYFNEKKNELIRRSNELFGDFTELMKQVKESLTDFSVTVPFDKVAGETIDYSINGNKLTVEVKYENETTAKCNRTTVIIPNNCDLEKVSIDTNEISKTATVTIPKKVIEPIKEEATPTEKPKKKTVRKKTAKKAVKKEETPEEETKEETMTHISSKLAHKLSQNSNKYARMMKRDSNGRFVRRTVKSD